MVKKLLIFTLCALCLASCKFRHIMSEEEYYAQDRAVIDFDIDWSDLEALGEPKPSGVTLYFYPCGDNVIDSTVQTVHSNNVDHVRAVLPNQDYNVICFNQSETEFSLLKFDLSSFDSARVQLKSSEELPEPPRGRYFDLTRGYNSSGRLKPGLNASTSVTSVQGLSTRGYNSSGRLKPGNNVSNMNVKVCVFGLNSSVSMQATLSNLSSGILLGSRTPLEETLNQELPDDMWTMDMPTELTLPGIVKTNFGTFGVNRNALLPTRAQQDDTDSLSLILDMIFSLPDGTTASFSVDVTDQIVHQLNQGNDTPPDMNILVGNPQDENGSNNSDTDYMTPDGSIVLHHTLEGTNVRVEGWSSNTINIEL